MIRYKDSMSDAILHWIFPAMRQSMLAKPLYIWMSYTIAVIVYENIDSSELGRRIHASFELPGKLVIKIVDNMFWDAY